MKHSVLVIGSGGREHAIVDALSRSAQVGNIYCAPGNAGIATQAQCVAISDTDVPALLAFAQSHTIDLTIVGPEAALHAGVVDAFRQAGLTIFGHSQAATRIESSKHFAKQLMAQYKVPTAAYHTFDNYDAALAFVQQGSFPTVLKYDGLAAGKGVVIASTLDEAEAALKDMLVDEKFGHGIVVIEEYLVGPEFSYMCFVNGSKVYPMPMAQDHKRAFDGNKGPNTGGMGAYTPLPFLTEEDKQFALTHIMQPVAAAMKREGLPLTGVLYGGLMRTSDGIRVIEFNARFGDPETEVVLPLLQSDAYDIFHAIATGEEPQPVQWSNKAVLGVVLASKGYPGSYDKGIEISGLEQFQGTVYHMGTKRENNRWLTHGGRVLMCLQQAETLNQAHKDVYQQLPTIKCENLFYRTDIGASSIENKTYD